MYFIRICQRKVSIKLFCALTILSIMACGFILISERQFCENQLWKSSWFFIHQPCLPNWAVLLLCLCLNSTRWWFMKRTFTGGVWDFAILSAPVSMKLIWGRSRQISHAPCIHHCTHKGPQNFLAFNFNLKFFSSCFLWLLEINCQPWVSKPYCTKTLLGWLLVDLFQEDRRCHRY